jgi:hypothetical protein
MRRGLYALAGAMILLTAWTWAQNASPRITAVEPAAGKVGENCIVSGENLGKETVTGVLLSDEEKDYPAEVVEQTEEKVIIKVPEVKPAPYNISLKIGNGIYIQPVRFTVEQ